MPSLWDPILSCNSCSNVDEYFIENEEWPEGYIPALENTKFYFSKKFRRIQKTPYLSPGQRYILEYPVDADPSNPVFKKLVAIPGVCAAYDSNGSIKYYTSIFKVVSTNILPGPISPGTKDFKNCRDAFGNIIQYCRKYVVGWVTGGCDGPFVCCSEPYFPGEDPRAICCAGCNKKGPLPGNTVGPVESIPNKIQRAWKNLSSKSFIRTAQILKKHNKLLLFDKQSLSIQNLISRKPVIKQISSELFSWSVKHI